MLIYKVILPTPLGEMLALDSGDGLCALEFTGPLFVATLGSMRLLDLVWVVLAVVGIVLLSPFADVSRGLDPAGVLLALAAGCCWGLYIIFAQKAGAQLGARTSAYGMAIAALVALPFGFTAAEPYFADPSSGCFPARCRSGWR